MNKCEELKTVGAFFSLIILSYFLSPLYIFLAGWDLANNELIKAFSHKNIVVFSTIVLTFLIYNIYMSIVDMLTLERFLIVVLAMLPIFVNIVYCIVYCFL